MIFLILSAKHLWLWVVCVICEDILNVRMACHTHSNLQHLNDTSGAISRLLEDYQYVLLPTNSDSTMKALCCRPETFPIYVQSHVY